ncbi:MAG: KEOPS complex subunit Pcc1 [Methanobacterium sp.]|jgi:KEOPS complex subunit Pcc1
MTLESVKAEFEMEFENQWEAEVILKSLEPEIALAPSQRSFTNLKQMNNILKMEICATDVTSFRAAINSYLRWIRLSYDVLKLK